MRNNVIITSALMILLSANAYSQEKWDLERCIKQMEVNGQDAGNTNESANHFVEQDTACRVVGTDFFVGYREKGCQH